MSLSFSPPTAPLMELKEEEQMEVQPQAKEEEIITFTWWFWDLIRTTTGFTPSSIAEVHSGIHRSYEVGERPSPPSAPGPELEALRAHLQTHLSALKRYVQRAHEREQDPHYCRDFKLNKEFKELRQKVQKTQPTAQTFFHAFETLACSKVGLTTLDATLQSLTRLKDLTLSCNSLQCLDHLPPNIQIVDASANSITQIGDISNCRELRHLGLCYNNIESVERLMSTGSGGASSGVSRTTTPATTGTMSERVSRLSHISSKPSELAESSWRNLSSLDLGFNRLTDIFGSLEALRGMENLRVLYLLGNPCSMAPMYRPCVVLGLSQLQLFDEIEVSGEEQQAAQSLTDVDDSMLSAGSAVMSSFTLDLEIDSVVGLPHDPFGKPIAPPEPENAKGKPNKKGKDAKEPRGKGGKAAPVVVQMEDLVKRERSTFVEYTLCGKTTRTDEAPLHPPKYTSLPPEEQDSGAWREEAEPVKLGHASSLTLPVSLEHRDELMKPLSFQVYCKERRATLTGAVRTYLSAPPGEIPEGLPSKEVLEALRSIEDLESAPLSALPSDLIEEDVTLMGTASALFSDCLYKAPLAPAYQAASNSNFVLEGATQEFLATQPEDLFGSEQQAEVEANQFVHQDHVRERAGWMVEQVRLRDMRRLERAKEKERKEIAAKEAAAKAAEEVSGKPPPKKGGKPESKKGKRDAKKEEEAPAEDEKDPDDPSIPIVDPVAEHYVNPSDLRLSITTYLSLNRPPPPPPPPPKEEEPPPPNPKGKKGKK